MLIGDNGMTIIDESKMDTQLDLFQKVSLRGYSYLLRRKVRPKWTLDKSIGKHIIHIDQTMPFEMDDIRPIPYCADCSNSLPLHLRFIVRKKSIRKMGE